MINFVVNFNVWAFIELLDKFVVFYMHIMIIVGIIMFCSFLINKMEDDKKG
jgi:hypothetical protein